MKTGKNHTLWLSFLGVTALPVIVVFIITIMVTRREFFELRRIYGPSFNADVRESLFMILIFVLGLIVIANSLWMIWMKGLVIKPIQDIEAATKRIASGDLNFSLETERNDEIGELCRDFEEMRKKLKESAEERLLSEQQQQQFISNICHDLKTPITSIQGYVEGIMDGVAKTPEMQDKYLKTIHNKASEMNLLINELTMYNKLDNNRIPYDFKIVPFKKYLDDCAVEIEDELETYDIGFTYNCYVLDSVNVIMDPEQFSRVIRNIIGNSVKYMDKENKWIKLSAREVGDSVEIEIEDNGQGISGRDLPRIFDRFYRADASRGKTKGSGIGLSIVKKVMEDHNGMVRAVSREGEGTAIYLDIRKCEKESKVE